MKNIEQAIEEIKEQRFEDSIDSDIIVLRLAQALEKAMLWIRCAEDKDYAKKGEEQILQILNGGANNETKVL